jgi:hypothetical protein
VLTERASNSSTSVAIGGHDEESKQIRGLTAFAHEFMAKDLDGNLFRVFYDFGTPESGGA